MRGLFAHDAVLSIGPDEDIRAPGAAITVALCGHWEHEPPCPLAPHHTHAERDGDAARLRILFAAQPADEAEVRARIDAALGDGELAGADGAVTRWRLVRSAAGSVRDAERDHAERLAAS
jgi:hypothetical protein